MNVNSVNFNLMQTSSSNKDELYNKEKLYDPFEDDNLLNDIKFIIFQNLKSYLPNLALVSKKWKQLVDCKQFRDSIRPAIAFGQKEWKEYIGVETGKEPPLPRRVYGDIEQDSYWLTLIPDKVNKTNVSGELECVMVDNLQTVYNLLHNCTKGNSISYSNACWSNALTGSRKIETTHWVMIRKKALENAINSPNYGISELNKKIKGAHQPTLIDTALSMLMEYVKSGQYALVDQGNRNKNFFVNRSGNVKNYVYVDDVVNGCKLSVGIASSSFIVRPEVVVYEGIECGSNAYVPAWKFYSKEAEISS